MRDVVVYSLLSLDGIAEEPSDWMFEVDSAVFENLARVIGTQDDVLLGRGTYDYWVDYWPTSDVQPFADFINTTTKHVVTSRPLTGAWPNTVVADAPLLAYVHALRERAGRDIGVHGSIGLVGQLLAADIVDRLELVIAPTLAGHGRRLFPDGLELSRLTLDGSGSTPSGTLTLSYRRP